MNAWFDKVDEIDPNRDIEDDSRGDSSGALRASSLLWSTWSTHINAHMAQTHAISSYITGQMIKGKMMCLVCVDPVEVWDILPYILRKDVEIL